MSTEHVTEVAQAINAVAADFPGRHAATRGFSLGVPRTITVGRDRTVFLRSPADDAKHSLWVLDTPDSAEASERCVVDADSLGSEANLSAEELALRERTRERGSGIVSYTVDANVERAVFVHNGSLHLVELESGDLQTLSFSGPVFDPRLSPDGTKLAVLRDGAVWVIDLTDDSETMIVGPEPDEGHVTWGLAEFVAAEEMHRTRGHWWSPDSDRLLVSRVDNDPVQTWWVGAPVDPSRDPVALRYPAAGTANATVSLHFVTLAGDVTDVTWPETDRADREYITEVRWTANGVPLVLTQPRNLDTAVLHTVEVDTGLATPSERIVHKPWLSLLPGTPTWTTDSRVVLTGYQDDVRVVLVDGESLGHTTDDGDTLTATRVVGIDDDAVTITADVVQRPWCSVVARLGFDGSVTLCSDPDGYATAVTGGGRIAVHQTTLTTPTQVSVSSNDGDTTTLASNAFWSPDVAPLDVVDHGPVGGQGDVVWQLFTPASWQPGDAPLPVLVDSYGGPSVRRVLAAANANLTAQWFAANGFAVVVIDGPGMEGQGLSWSERIAGDLANPPLNGQIEGLHAAAAAHPGVLDLDRVAIRGWSFGGYLSALAVLRRPDVFHAAIAGAPVTEWRLYDTYYTERFMGHPDDHAEAYDASSLCSDAAKLDRPLLLIHGLADDNVVAAHTLQLSRALLEAGRPHDTLILSDVTHFTPSEVINTNMWLLQLQYLRRSLGLTAEE